MASLPQYKQDFLRAAVEGGCLKFGSFTLKSGRTSPYFFNAGDFYTGALHAPLMDAYARTLADSGLDFDVIFGPAYKGIPLAATALYALCKLDGGGGDRFRQVAYSYDRKEAKDHGEGGSLVGAPLRGRRVVVIDDVVSAGTAKRQAVDLIRAQGGEVVGIVVALDRQETLPGGDVGSASAIGQLRKEYGFPILAIVKLDDIIAGMKGVISDGDIEKIVEYRSKFGASD
ncbi:orotate phosphoribosyltransferase-like protein [Xylariomycetidae sp. FL2044]|nr:orotate phosphoribosyltransferase-like protein [Xylariomycetidae sp. FL2044]